MGELFTAAPTTGYTLRDYQAEAVNNTVAAFTGGIDGEPPTDRALGVMATGAGKTVVFSFIAQHFVAMGWRVLILVDQIELAEQAREKLLEACGIYAQIEQGNNRATLDASVVIGSVQTMSGRGLEKYPRDHFKLVICDEADRSLSSEWQAVLKHFHDHAKVLGVTATPFRGDKQSLMPYFRQLVFNVPMFRLIDEGYLSPIEVQQLPVNIDLSQVHQSAGDFDRDELNSVLEPAFDELASLIHDRAADRRKILVFTPLIPTSMRFVQACARGGLDARHVDGESKERKRTLEWFHQNDGHQRILSNAMLLQRGWDEPSVDCICILRPTRSRSAYWQMVGRGTRLWCPNRCPAACQCQGAKHNLLLLDPLWQHGKIAPMRPADLIAETSQQAAGIAKQLTLAKGKRVNLQVADSEAAREAEMALLQTMEAATKRKPRGRLMDPTTFAALAHRLDVATFEPVDASQARPVTRGQRGFLERLGVDADCVETYGHASALITVATQRRESGMASVKMMAALRKYKVKYPDQVSAANAKIFMDAKWNRGRLPAGFNLYAPPEGQIIDVAPDAQGTLGYDPDPEPDRGPDPDDYTAPVATPAPPPVPAPGRSALGSGIYTSRFAEMKRQIQGDLFGGEK